MKFFTKKEWLIILVGSVLMTVFLTTITGAANPGKPRKKRPGFIANYAVKCTGTCVYKVVDDPNAPNGKDAFLVQSNCAQVIGCACTDINFVPGSQMHTGDLFYGSCTTGQLPVTEGCEKTVCQWLWSDEINDWEMGSSNCEPTCACVKPNLNGTYTPYGTNLVISVNYYVNLNGDVVERPARFLVAVPCSKSQLQ